MSAGNPQLVEAVQQRLAALGVAEVAVGQDAYFKGVIRHRGIKMPALDATCKEFLAGQQEAAPAELRQLGLELLRQPLQEDKIAGMNVLRHCLTKGGLAPQWASELQALEELYASGHVFAWSTCDGICGRVLAPLIKLLLQSAPAEGQACSQAVMGWCRHDCLWLRRTSVVTFVTLARLPDQQVFPGFGAALLGTLAVTVRGQERFAQTGTGWVLREVGKGNAEVLLQFVESNLAHFSAEGLRYALEHQSPAVRKRLTAQHKEQLAAAAASAAAAGVQHSEGGLAAAECDAAPAKRRRRG